MLLLAVAVATGQFIDVAVDMLMLSLGIEDAVSRCVRQHRGVHEQVRLILRGGPVGVPGDCGDGRRQCGECQ